MVTRVKKNKGLYLLLSPNCSASWLQTKVFFLCLTFVVFVIALGWSLLGAWIILPFAGVEMAVLAIALYHCSLRSYQKQVIELTCDSIKLSQGNRQPTSSHTLPIVGTYLSLKLANKPHGKTELFLVSQGQQWPIGPFLNEADLINTKNQLVEAGIPLTNQQWWRTK